MSRVVSVNPFRCRMWFEHERLEDYVTDSTCKSEIKSFKRHGQLLPALGRPVLGDERYEVELIYGSRRLLVARHLNMPLKVELRELTDKEALIALDIENRQRKNVSAYERGVAYLRWLRSGIFESQEDLSRTLGVSASQVSRLLKLARLPAVIISAFQNPLEIREQWATDLFFAWKERTHTRRMVDRARAIASRDPRPSALDVYRILVGAVGDTRASVKERRAEVVRSRDGKPLFRIKHQRRTVALQFSTSALSAEILESVKSVIAELLQSETAQVLTPKQHFSASTYIVPFEAVSSVRDDRASYRDLGSAVIEKWKA